MPLGTDIIQLAEDHIGESYVLGERAPMNHAEWRGPWDCAEFASWCVYQATGILYGTRPRNDPVRADAYTGYWKRQAKKDKAYISVEEAAHIPGACVLRIPASQRSGHIVFSDGQGGTIEAHSREHGVCRKSLSGRRWDTGILVPGVQYVTNISASSARILIPEGIILRLTKPMMQGSIVRAVQNELQRRGYFPGTIDGIYGPQVESSVIRFQAASGLVADGEIGELTFAALEIRP